MTADEPQTPAASSPPAAADPAGGWSLRFALAVVAGLMTLVALVIAIGVRMFDRFDTVTELMIGAVIFLALLMLNGGVIYFLHSMPTGAARRAPGEAKGGAHG